MLCGGTARREDIRDDDDDGGGGSSVNCTCAREGERGPGLIASVVRKWMQLRRSQLASVQLILIYAQVSQVVRNISQTSSG